MRRPLSFETLSSENLSFEKLIRSRTAIAGLLGAAVVIGLVAAAAPAVAGTTPKPAVPSDLKVVATSRSGFTVALAPCAHGRTYRVYASTVKADLYQSSIAQQGSRATDAVATTPRVTVSGLQYTTAPYYYRVSVSNGNRTSWSKVSRSGARLEPSAPSSVSVVSGSQGEPVLHWSSGASTGYSIRQSTSSTFSTGVTSYVSRGPDTEFTPSAAATGKTYYYRVRALNGSSASPFSPVVSATVHPRKQTLRALTYNVRSANLAHDEAPWSKRLPAVVGLIKSDSPDVFGVQEAGAYVHGRTRQVDTIASHLSGYKVANTDTMPGGDVVRWHGDYIVYRRSAMTPIRKGGQWTLGQQHYAAYNAFRTKQGARLLFVSTHLMTGSGTTPDSQRKSETAALLKDAHAYANKLGISSIMVVGDFNSYYGRWHTVDTPGNAMRSAGMSDAKLAAQHLYNSRYSSINGYHRKAPTGGGASDHVYSSPGIGVSAWGELLDVKHGRFVGVIPSDHNAVWSNVVLPIG